MQKINWETVKQYSSLTTKDGANLYLKLLSTYKDNIYDELTRIDLGVKESNFEESAALAHKLKSSSGNLGLDTIYSALDRIETELSEGAEKSPLLVRSLLDTIKEDLTDCLDELAEFLE